MYIQYLIETKQAASLAEAYFYAARSAEMLYKRAKEEDNLVIFGNMSINYKFDAVFNFQNNTFDAYRDVFLEALNEVLKDDEETNELLTQYTKNLHKADESSLILVNIDAASNFINSYMSTNVEQQLIELQQNYLSKLKEINDLGKATREVKKILNDNRENNS